MMESRLIYTIGHSSLSEQAFTAQLVKFHVTCVVDVRRYPGSRRHPQFGRHALAESLERAAIDYLHLGGLLGGYVDVPYEEYRSTAAFKEGLRRLEERALESRCAFMCAEKNPWHCHRRFIAETLTENGWTVRHIVDAELLLV